MSTKEKRQRIKLPTLQTDGELTSQGHGEKCWMRFIPFDERTEFSCNCDKAGLYMKTFQSNREVKK